MPIFKPSARIQQRYRRLKLMRPDNLVEALQQIDIEDQAHPDHAAMQALERHLVAAHFDPAITASSTFVQLVLFLREWIGDSHPGDTLSDRFAALHRELSKFGGGRPQKVDHATVNQKRTDLEAAWNPAPVSETARQLGLSRRTVSRAKKSRVRGETKGGG